MSDSVGGLWLTPTMANNLQTLVTAILAFASLASSVPYADKAGQHVEVDPEIDMGPTELITSKGYPCQNHYVTTPDGFILNLQRIPHGRQSSSISSQSGVGAGAAGKPAVLLQHGLLGSSTNWLDNLANESLPYLLADHGADVWLGNIRGNTFSRNHTSLHPDQDVFWDWSYDEMAALDLPAMLDHVRLVSGVEQKFFELFGHGAYDQYNKRLHDFLAPDVCQRLGQALCEDDLFIIGGVDKPAMNMSRVPVYIAHSPGGTSVKNILHFAQGVDSKTFQMFDYGSADANKAKYGQPTPPQYHPKDLRVPVVAYTGGQDILADPTDVAWLLKQISPSLVATHHMPSWEHLDFIWAVDAPKYCYNDHINWVFHD